MKRLQVHNNERGLTLVEILASLVILGIVFVGFMTVFPQMTNFNEKTGSKLETMNLARLKLEDFKKPKYFVDFNESDVYLDNGNTWIKIERDSYGKLEIKYFVEKTPAVKSNDVSGQVNLHEVSIIVSKNDKIISETFGYVEVHN